MKRGFTLPELIAVLIVLSFIAMIAIPAVTKVIKENKTNICVIQFDNIIEDAKGWASDNIEKLPINDDDAKITVSFDDLVKYGYAGDSLIDPITKEGFTSEWAVQISNSLHKLEYKIVKNNVVIDTRSYCR